jgi:hypothetical protein
MDRFRKYPFLAYYWYVPNPTTGRMRRTRYRMTESEASKYPGAVKDIFESLEIASPEDEERAG